MKTCPMCGSEADDPAVACRCGYAFKTGVAAEAAAVQAGPVVQSGGSDGGGMRGIGTALWILGLLVMGYSGLMPNSVTTEPSFTGGVYTPGSEVVNLALVQAQSFMFGLGAVAFLGGLLLYGCGAVVKAIAASRTPLR